MTTHTIKPGTPVDRMAMRCGLLGEDATDADQIAADGSDAVDCPGCLRDLIKDMRLAELGEDSHAGRWLAGGDTGISSVTIWSVMAGRTLPRELATWGPDVPHDPADFGRCHRLLQEFPAWRDRMPEVAAHHSEWSGLVRCWDELTTLYLEELPTGQAPRLYARMKELEADR